MSILCFTQVKAQTYEGTIGSYNIFSELDIDYDDDRGTAFYFYNSQLLNIQLEGNYNDSELILFEQYSTKEEQKEFFTLSINKDIILGTWQNNEKTLAVYLTKTTKNIDEYKLKQLEFIRDNITKYNNKELVWITEKHSKKQLFRLGNGFTKLEREFMNPILDSIHTQNSIIGLDCSWADFNIEIELISNQYISFSEYSSIYCGGEHPSHNIAGYNFDLKKQV